MGVESNKDRAGFGIVEILIDNISKGGERKARQAEIKHKSIIKGSWVLYKHVVWEVLDISETAMLQLYRHDRAEEYADPRKVGVLANS